MGLTLALGRQAGIGISEVGGLELVAFADTRSFLDGCVAGGVLVLGIEGFYFERGQVRLDMRPWYLFVQRWLGVEGSAMTNIPSEEEFVRAKRLAREEWRNLDRVCEAILKRFRKIGRLHDVHILPQRDVDLRAYIFLERDSDITEFEESGVIEEIKEAVYTEIERSGRGKRSEITVDFEFDSDENVARNFEGDYFLRLR